MKFARAILGGMLVALASTSLAQQAPILIYGIMELSGTGATPGTNFDNGVKLAVKEINAAGVAIARKAVGEDAYVVGSVGAVRGGAGAEFR